MSLACPHCKHDDGYGWMSWEKEAIVKIEFTSAMCAIAHEGARGSFQEDESEAYLCECPACHKQVVYMSATYRLSDITNESTFTVCTVDEAKLTKKQGQ
jgi:hypothetical protein